MEMVYGTVYRLRSTVIGADWEPYATCYDPAEAENIAARCGELDGNHYYGWIDEKGNFYQI